MSVFLDMQTQISNFVAFELSLYFNKLFTI